MESLRLPDGREIGPGHPAYVIAEMSANHGGSFETAARILQAAADAGADAVKIQTYTADTMTIDSDREYFRIGGGTLWDGRTLYDLYREASTPWEWHPRLKEIARELKLDFFSTPFDDGAVAFLEEQGVPLYKVASFEIVDLALVRTIAATGKPMILSTGMSTLSEIREAVETARAAGATQIALLKCTSAYPAPPDEINLQAIPSLAQEFDVPVGFSDHTEGIAVPAAAVAVGASILEKHFTLSRRIETADSAFSLEPAEFRAMVDAVRTTEKALGSVEYGVSENEARSRVFRRSLFVVETVRAGALFNERNVRSIRPANGLHPRHLTDVLGRRARVDIERGTPLTWDLVEPAPGHDAD